ncbi:MAG: endonuclease [Clostridium sp.]|uniref:type I restriction endonuclease n=1 Tax=Intestinibacter bartlettii TaxID=261299 RepID=UPI000D792B64|nr:type I restriction endonuclease [Intestinibacter bartlettii]MDU2694224.1 type I restriction endonuclease [Intestinibacter bartlettii]PWM77920.1 MAG: endonuclease [Clostridium sp.]
MDFNEKIRNFIDRIETIKDTLTTEEATKTALIMPFFQLLDYDVFNPLEFVPEYVADIGVKRGEKVDYAIIKNGKPIIIIEAKSVTDKLKKHDTQLMRYFSVTEAKFAILTNGINYKFFTDLDHQNMMDEKPFLEINLLNATDNEILQLKKFAKNTFNLEAISSTASNLKYIDNINDRLKDELENPSDDFVRFMINDFYVGVKNKNVVDKFRPIVQKALSQFATDFMNEKIQIALGENAATKLTSYKNSSSQSEKEQTKLITKEELEALEMIREILSDVVDKEDITYKSTKSYFGINYKNNSNNWICRLFLYRKNKMGIHLPDENKDSIKYDFDEINDLKDIKPLLEEIIKRYI